MYTNTDFHTYCNAPKNMTIKKLNPFSAKANIFKHTSGSLGMQ